MCVSQPEHLAIGFCILLKTVYLEPCLSGNDSLSYAQVFLMGMSCSLPGEIVAFAGHAGI